MRGQCGEVSFVYYKVARKLAQTHQTNRATAFCLHPFRVVKMS